MSLAMSSNHALYIIISWTSMYKFRTHLTDSADYPVKYKANRQMIAKKIIIKIKDLVLTGILYLYGQSIWTFHQGKYYGPFHIIKFSAR